jgi:NADH:ubiquinone oxidoreductase subunit E
MIPSPNREWLRSNAHRTAQVCAAVIGVLFLVLMVDWAWASVRTPKDDKLFKDLQQQVKQDAALAPKLAAEQKSVTAWRQSRKRRDKVAGWALLGVALLFLTSAKEALRQRPQAGSSGARLVTIAASMSRAARNGCSHAAPAIDLAFVDQLVAEKGRGLESAIPMLQAIQQHYRYLPDEALRRLCELTDITPAQVAGTSSFYGQFRRSPVGEHIVRVCHGTACHVSGARQVTDELRRYLELPDGADTDASRTFTVEEVACLGCCSLAPVMMVDGHTAGRLTPSAACDTLKPFERQETR